MSLTVVASKALQSLRTGLVSLAMFQFVFGTSFAAPQADALSADAHTQSPIKHVIVILGENRTFDHV